MLQKKTIILLIGILILHIPLKAQDSILEKKFSNEYITINYPKDWAITNNSIDEINGNMIFFIKNSDNSNIIIATTNSKNEIIDPIEGLEQIFKVTKKMMPNIKKINLEHFMLDNNVSAKLTLQNKINEITFIQNQYYVIKNDKLFIINTTVNIDDKYDQKTITRIVNSLKIK